MTIELRAGGAPARLLIAAGLLLGGAGFAGAQVNFEEQVAAARLHLDAEVEATSCATCDDGVGLGDGCCDETLGCALGGCDAGGCSAGGCGADCDDCDMFMPSRHCGSGHVPGYIYGEFLYLRPTGGDITHAQQQDGNGGAGTVPFGRIGTVDYDYQPGFRVGGGLCLDGCSSINVNYTRFEGDGEDSLGIPSIPGGSGAVGSLVHHPGTALTASSGPVTATSYLDYHLADIMFRDIWKRTNCSQLKYSLGGVYAGFDQDFQQLGQFSGGAGGAIRTDATIDFDGAGLKGGLDYERWLGHGLSVYGRASAAAVSGRFQSRYNLTNDSTDVNLGEAIWKDNRVV